MAAMSCAPDDEMAAITLQIEDIDHLIQRSRHPLDRPTDLEEARATYRAELVQQLSILRDRKHAQDIAQAGLPHTPTVASTVNRGRQRRRDQRLTRQMGNLILSHESAATEEEAVQSQINNLSPDLAAPDVENNKDGPSKTIAVRQDDESVGSSTQQDCVACLNDFLAHEMVTLPCEHKYCTDCLKRLFINATKDESIYPPRCCRQPISLEIVSPSMSREELQAFQEASIEFTTGNRVYCSNKSCGKFVPPAQFDHMSDRAECGHCGRSTCIHCKEAPHAGECPDDPGMKGTLELARERGWQQCTGCSSIVELTVGCYHMVYKCGYQFCYLCGERWNTCTCNGFEEQRLFDRAAEVVARETPLADMLNRIMARPRPVAVTCALPPPAPSVERDVVARAAETRRMANYLHTAHECAHKGRLIHVTGTGPYTCELCSQGNGESIMRCHQCRTHICDRCLRNRLR